MLNFNNVVLFRFFLLFAFFGSLPACSGSGVGLLRFYSPDFLPFDKPGDVKLLDEFPYTRLSFSLPEQDVQGWSIITPSADSRLVYVSTSGNDESAKVYASDSVELGGNPYNPSGKVYPYASIDAALAQVRNGYPDFIFLNRGDTWTRASAINIKAGRSAKERIVLTYYGGATARPVVKGFGLNLNNASYSAIVGIHFSASQRNPESSEFVGFSKVENIAGFNGLAGYGNTLVGGLLIEDCRFDWFSGNVLQSPQLSAPELRDVIIRRNFISNNYSVTGHSQGLYSDRASIWLEGNVFDHNGWYKQGDAKFSDTSEGKATMFNHNTYFGSARESVFINNIFSRASSMGNKFTSNTSSGTNEIKSWDVLIDNNLYVEGEIGISLGGNDDQNNGPRWRNIHVTNNVMLHLGRSQPTLRTLGWGLDVKDWQGGLVSNNIFAHWGDAVLNNNYAIQAVGHTTDVAYRNNIVYNVSSASPLVYFLEGSIHTGISFTDNELWTNHTGPLMSYALAGKGGFGGNYFYSKRSPAKWFLINGVDSSLQQYKQVSGDGSSIAAQSNYVDPERTIETYLTSQGYPSDMNAFAERLKQQSKFNWSPALTAPAINDYIRAGFKKKGLKITSRHLEKNRPKVVQVKLPSSDFHR